MDPLSILTAVAGLGTALFQVSNAITTFVKDIKEVDGVLESMRADIRTLSGILDTFKDVYEEAMAQPAFESVKGSGMLRDSMMASLQDCQETVTEIQKIIEAVMNSSEARRFFKQSVRQLRLNKKQVDIDKVQTRLQTHKINLQMSLQMLNLLIAISSPHMVIDNIGSRIDELTEAIAESKINERTVVGPPSYEDSNGENLHRHTIQLVETAREMISRTNPVINRKDEPDPESDIEPESDSDDEFEAKLSLRALKRGSELCGQKKYQEAESSLRNALKGARSSKLARSKTEEIEIAEVKLAEAYLYQEKWSEAEVALSVFIKTHSGSKEEDANLAEAYYFRAQLYLARHDFDNAQRFCRKAIRAQKRLFGKNHPTYYRSTALLILVFETSGDKDAAADYLDTVPRQYLEDTEHLACTRFSSKGCCLSIDQEIKAEELFKKDYNSGHGYPEPLNVTLRSAAGDGQKDLLRLLLWRKANVNGRNLDGGTALMVAAAGDKEDILSLLLEKGADIHLADNRGENVLFRPARTGNENVIRFLLDRGASVDSVNRDGENLVFAAARHDNVNAVALFIAKGVDVDLDPKYRRTALMYAARDDYTDVVVLLLHASANVNKCDKSGCTALTLAAEADRHDIIKLLVDFGAALDVLDCNDHSPLMLTAAAYDPESLRLLIEKGADINLTGGAGRGALYMAVDRNRPEAVKMLLEKGADPEQHKPEHDQSPLMVASREGYTEVAQLLLESGAKLDASTTDGYTPLRLAKGRGNYEIVKLLQEYGAKE